MKAPNLAILISVFLGAGLPLGAQGVNKVNADEQALVSTLQALAASNHQLSADLYQQAAGREGNLVFSPSSVLGVLVAFLTGEEGDSESEMRKAIGLSVSRARLEKALPVRAVHLRKGINEKERFFLGLQIEQRKDGVYVKSVATRSAAEQAAFRAGDQLLSVRSGNDVAQEIRTAADWIHALDEAAAILRVRCRPAMGPPVLRVLHVPKTRPFAPAAADPQARNHGILWLRSGYTPPTPVMNMMRDALAADTRKVDFSNVAVKRAVTWLGEQLQPERAIKLPDGLLGPDLRLAYTDAVSVRPNWASNIRQTVNPKFVFSFGETKALLTALALTGSFRVNKTAEVQSVEVPCTGGLAVICLLPHRPTDLPAFEKKLVAGELPKLLGAGTLQEATVELPVTDLVSALSLRNSLRMTHFWRGDEKKLKEAGVHGAAATVLHQTQLRILPKDKLDAPPASKTIIRLDRAFHMLVYDRQTKEILVLARIVDPR